MGSTLVEPTLYFYTLFLDNDYGTTFSFKLVLPKYLIERECVKNYSSSHSKYYI
jgi:hypothetical protein